MADGNDGGGGGTDTKEWLPEEYREDVSFKDVKDLPSLLKTYKNQESMIGSRIKPPSDDSTDDEYNDFVSKIRPKDVKDYGIEADESLLKTLHETGVPKRMAKNLVDKFGEMQQELKSSSAAKDKEQKEKAFESLVKEYGDKEKAEAGLKEINKLVDKTIGEKFPEFRDFMDNATVKVGDEEIALANHPVMAKALKVVLDMTTDDDKNLDGDGATQEDLEQQWLDVVSEMTKSEHGQDEAEYQKLITKKNKIQEQLSKFGS